MPTALGLQTAESSPRHRYHTVETAEDGSRRYRRVAIPPRGAKAGRRVERRRTPDELLGCPDPIPAAWLEEPPSWLQAAEGVRIIIDPDSPELGRAAGYVFLWGTCLRNGRNECREPIPSPTDHARFHRGEADIVREDGTVETVAVGAVPITGGHGDRWGVDGQPRAKQAEAAMRVLDQPERQGLVGVLVEDEVGCLFLGAGIPELTVAEARMINRSDVSMEWWPIVEVDDETRRPVLTGLDALGPVLVTRGAFEKSSARLRVLASLGVDPDSPDADALTADALAGAWVDTARLRVLAALTAAGVDDPDDTLVGEAVDAWMVGPVNDDDPVLAGSRWDGGGIPVTETDSEPDAPPGPMFAELVGEAHASVIRDGWYVDDAGNRIRPYAPAADPADAGPVLAAPLGAEAGDRLIEIEAMLSSILERLEGVDGRVADLERQLTAMRAAEMEEADVALPDAVDSLDDRVQELTVMFEAMLEQQRQQQHSAMMPAAEDEGSAAAGA